MINREPLQLFRMSSKILENLNFSDVSETWKDMIEAKIAFPPFNRFAIEVRLDFMRKFADLMRNREKADRHPMDDFAFYCEYEVINIDFEKQLFQVETEVKIIKPNGKIFSEETKARIEGDEDSLRFFESGADVLVKTLIVLLATKNTKKESFTNKILAKGKSNGSNEYRKNYPTTTTISLGKINETFVKDGEDVRNVRPHLRRGHLRNQHYGPNKEMVKQIFIAPVFVNASEGWIAERKAYNVSMHH